MRNSTSMASSAKVAGSGASSHHSGTESTLMIVPLIVFFALQRYFVQGLLAGSVKT